MLTGLKESIEVKQRLLVECADTIVQGGGVLVEALQYGGKILLFGNGGMPPKRSISPPSSSGDFSGSDEHFPRSR